MNPQNEDMSNDVDFAGGRRGVHHIRAKAQIFLPVMIERTVWEYFSSKADQRGVGLSDLLTEVLQRDIEISEALQ